MIVLVVLGIVIALLPVIALWKGFTKAGRPGWAAIVPFYNAYVVVKIGGRPGWWFWLLLIPGLNVVIAIIVALDIARSFGKGIAFAIFGLIIFSVIGVLVLGFGNARYLGPRPV